MTRELKESGAGLRLYDTVDSTNTEAKRYTLDGGETPAVFLAETQTAGRGRMGRSVFSPDGTGIYLTVLRRCEGALSDGVLLTTAAAVAVRRAILRVTGISTEIKWVNDLLLNGKKVAGILAESFPHEGQLYLILGVGVNLSTADFPEELSSVAGSLRPGENGLRNELAAALANELLSLGWAPSPDSFIDEYRAASAVLGKRVTYLRNGIRREGIASEIDGRGRLTVVHDDGSRVLLSEGEITLRLA